MVDEVSIKVDTITMATKLSQLFSSGAKVEILEALYYASNGLGLRKIAATCHLHVHSAEVALKQMHKERLLRRSQKGSRVFYSLNKESNNYQLLKELFLTAEANKIRERAASFRNEGIEVMKFITSSQRMIDHARRSYLGAK